MGGHGHHEPYTIPDYKIYKVENCPELVEVKNSLAAKGLRDPWLRNEVWRFNPKEFKTHPERFRGFFLRGLTIGFAAFFVTIAAETLYKKAHPSDHGHH